MSSRVVTQYMLTLWLVDCWTFIPNGKKVSPADLSCVDKDLMKSLALSAKRAIYATGESGGLDHEMTEVTME